MRENKNLKPNIWKRKRQKLVKREIYTGVVFVIVLLALIVGFFFTSAFLTDPR